TVEVAPGTKTTDDDRQVRGRHVHGDHREVEAASMSRHIGHEGSLNMCDWVSVQRRNTSLPTYLQWIVSHCHSLWRCGDVRQKREVPRRDVERCAFVGMTSSDCGGILSPCYPAPRRTRGALRRLICRRLGSMHIFGASICPTGVRALRDCVNYSERTSRRVLIISDSKRIARG